MSLFYVDKPFFQGAHAGVKPKNDLIKWLKIMGFQGLQDHQNLSQSDIVFFYYPFSYDWEREVFMTLSLNQIPTILLIMDIRSLTHQVESLKTELEIFNQATYLIVHNEKMEHWLKERAVCQSMFTLELFDYWISDQVFQQIPKRSLTHEIVFAGCLHPKLRSFLYDQNYEHQYQLNVYGPDLIKDINSSCKTYLGVYVPEVIPAYLKGSFGLHWNGASIESCIGAVSDYSKIVTSHKISLYLISKLPIICWEHSSEANWIRDNRLGILISNLNDIDDKLHDITERDYDEMIQNVTQYSKRLKEGYYFQRVIKEILSHAQLESKT